jgi:hypothetical protein
VLVAAEEAAESIEIEDEDEKKGTRNMPGMRMPLSKLAPALTLFRHFLRPEK